MNIFGIPLFISIDVIQLFIDTNFANYIVSNDTIVLLFFIVNFMYIYCIYLLIKFFYKLIIFVKNHVFS